MAAVVISALMAVWGVHLVTTSMAQRAEVQQSEAPGPYDSFVDFRGEGCDAVLAQHGPVAAVWSSTGWIELTSCFEVREDHRLAARAAAAGLSYHPQSETLHNMRGYNLIVLGEYDRAVSHLRASLLAIEPTNSILENNLAWAGLYASKKMTLTEARRHYRAAMVFGATCETVHTGMWVEYGIAARSHGSLRDGAIAEYRQLRAKYEPCTSRLRQQTKHVAYEVAGAGILDGEMHKLHMVQLFERNQIDDGFAPLNTTLVEQSVRSINLPFSEVNEACDEIAPVRSAIPACRKALTSATWR